MVYVDFHLHSFFSDGLDTPIQLVRAAKTKGLDMISITDHDNLLGYSPGAYEAKKWKMDFVPGVEITAIEHHILGLNYDPKSDRFQRFVKESQQIQIEVCKQRIELVRLSGVPISISKVMNAFPKSSLGKYAILRTMFLDDDCRKYLRKKHADCSFQNLFSLYLSSSGVAGRVERRRFITWNDAVYEIHRAGGIAIIPHPAQSVSTPVQIEHLLRNIDGIEVQPRFAEKTKPFSDYARKNHLLITYGSDYHSSVAGSPILERSENILDKKTAKLFRR